MRACVGLCVIPFDCTLCKPNNPFTLNTDILNLHHGILHFVRRGIFWGALKVVERDHGMGCNECGFHCHCFQSAEMSKEFLSQNHIQNYFVPE